MFWFNIIGGCFVSSLGMMLSIRNINNDKNNKLIHLILFVLLFTGLLVFQD